MILPGSYANGFAPRDGRPIYPSLWRGCVNAVNPSLGPTGTTLRDWSGFKNDGILTGGPAYVLSSGRYCVSLDGVDDYVDLGSNVIISDQITVCAFVNIAASRMTLLGYTAADANNKTHNIGTTGARVPYFQWSLAGNTYFSMSGGAALQAGRWYHLAFTRNGASASIFVDGVDVTPTLSGASAAALQPNTTTKTIGRTLTIYSNGAFTDYRIYRRSLTQNEIKLLASRPGIANELAPRRRSSVAVAAFNRRRRLLVGAHS